MSSTRVAIKRCPLLRGTKGNNYLFGSLQLTSDSPKKSTSIVQYGNFPIFKARFPHNYWLHAFLQNLSRMLPTWAWELDYEFVDFVPLREILMDQSCQKMHLVLKQRGNQIFTFSNPPMSFFSQQGVNLDSFTLEGNFSLPCISKYDFYIGFGILMGQMWKKWFLFRHISKFQLVLLKKYRCELLYQVLNWCFHTTAGLFYWKFSGFIPYSWLNFSIKISINNFFLR